MAPQDDLTAERAAIKLYEKILSYSPDPEALNAGDDKDFEAIMQALKTVRQEALREAARVAVDVLTETAARWDDFADLNEGGIKYTNIGFMRASARRCRDAVKQLDRLASEGG